MTYNQVLDVNLKVSCLSAEIFLMWFISLSLLTHTGFCGDVGGGFGDS